MKDAISYSLTGPMIRSVGIKKDLRLTSSEGYASYWSLSITSFVGKNGDSYDRFLIRVREMYESTNLVFQVISNLSSLSQTTELGLGSVDKVDPYSFSNFLNQVTKAKARRLSKFTSMEFLIQHFKNYSEGQSVPKGLVYTAVEAPKGELGVSIVSDSTPKPFRCKIRTPAFHHMHSMSRLSQGHYLADLVTILGSQDIVFGDVDR